MFIIVGHDIKSKQVLVHDTKDHTTQPVSYGILRKALSKGIKVYGLDFKDNIICNTLDVLLELKPQLQTIVAKALLLQLDTNKILELLFPICVQYGLVEEIEDLIFNAEPTPTLIFCLTGQMLQFNQEPTSSWLYSITDCADFAKIEDELTHFMLKELYKIPIMSDKAKLIISEIKYIADSYYIRLQSGLTLCIDMAYYTSSYHKDLINSRVTNHVLYKHYLRKLEKYRPDGPYFISNFKFIARFPSSTLTAPIYVRHGGYKICL